MVKLKFEIKDCYPAIFPKICDKCGKKFSIIWTKRYKCDSGWVINGLPYYLHGPMTPRKYVCKKCCPTKESANNYFYEKYVKELTLPSDTEPKPVETIKPKPVITLEDQYNDKSSIRGVIVAEKCGCCGHHEIGIRKENGNYVQLKPGMKIVGYLTGVEVVEVTEAKDYYVDCSKQNKEGV